MFLNHALFILFRNVSPEAAMESWVRAQNGSNIAASSAFLYKNPDGTFFRAAMRSGFSQYSPDEAVNIYSATQQLLRSPDKCLDAGVFGLLSYAAESMLRLDGWNECLCRFQNLLQFREMSHPIGAELFQAAFLAREDMNRNFTRTTFSFPPVIRTDNIRLHQVLDRGMAENHFHIGGSVSAFLYSWICLMNHMSCDREREFRITGLDKNPLDQSSPGFCGTTSSFYSLVFKAVCIRYFLFMRLHDSYPIPSSGLNSEEKTDDRKRIAEKWLLERLQSEDAFISFYMTDLNHLLSSCREVFCGGTAEKNFIPDYAIENEPLPPMDDDDIHSSSDYAVRNFERRVYRSLSGEQRFLYKLFRALYEKDNRILPYADLVYAYLLIYCKFRGELIQTNHTVGFANFADYQDRKDVFSWKYPKYSLLRSRTAQQAVMLNPQIRTLEGRMIPGKTNHQLIKKITDNYRSALYSEDFYTYNQKEYIQKCAEEKLHYVLHFPKGRQEIKADNEIGNCYETTHSKDSIIRERTLRQIDAIIQARSANPQKRADGDTVFMPITLITGIDACANEIGCRPEVFAPAFRKIRQERKNVEERLNSVGTDVLPVMRITYHVGEDFLDLVDGLRAIEEAINFLELGSGDRLGHAMALGVDPSDWYASKNHTIILPMQDLMDNMAWIMGKMHEYNIYDRTAEDEIDRVFRKCFEDIVLSGSITDTFIQSVDIKKHYASMMLRGNDPLLYYAVPANSVEYYKSFQSKMREKTSLAPWRVQSKNVPNTDWLSARLYHHYHFNPQIKRRGSEQIEYRIPYALVQIVSKIQKKMQHKIAALDIGIETNPSSNYLIGTFRNYCKHPIFSFNDSRLYDSPDNPHLFVSINTDDLGIFDTSLENEYAILACALYNNNEYLSEEERISPERIYDWIDHIRQMGCDQSFRHVRHF